MNTATNNSNLDFFFTKMKVTLNEGKFVFCIIDEPDEIDFSNLFFLFRERGGYTIIVKKELADHQDLDYTFTAAWITLTVYSVANALGPVPEISAALAKGNIGCHIISTYYHEHIFVDHKHLQGALEILRKFSV